ncbi:GATA zinc finger domain-containing protein 10 [Citrus sinensis]|uniref:GATA zinc finger domain-containing protein 10 n=1 Tax=Citrus sinensis TaxID=2711 RepID=A0ACB8JQZ5_CITSI|nr:GATA zinc finger domain-containing protein 10 [Citrus sinensis]
MALVTTATETLCLKNPFANLLTPSFPIAAAAAATSGFLPCALSAIMKERRGLLCRSFALKNEVIETADGAQQAEEEEEEKKEMEKPRETLLYSIAPLPLLFVAALPGAGTVRALFGPFVELVKSWNLPDWLVHWGHPGNMAVVLFAMGGYGTYLGFCIRYSDDMEEKAKAKDLHPKLLGGMFFFFALGATGGITSLLTSDKPIFESPHAVTGFIGLALLTIQIILPALFEGNPGLRNVHGILGSGIMTSFLIHAALGLQLGLSY